MLTTRKIMGSLLAAWVILRPARGLPELPGPCAQLLGDSVVLEVVLPSSRLLASSVDASFLSVVGSYPAQPAAFLWWLPLRRLFVV